MDSCSDYLASGLASWSSSQPSGFTLMSLVTPPTRDWKSFLLINPNRARTSIRYHGFSSTLLGPIRVGAGHQSSYNLPTGRRHYAERVVSRPKAHTGRTTAAPRKKATVVVKTTPAGRKSTGGSARTRPKPKSTTRSAAKSKVKARPRTKSKAKSKPKRKPKAKPKPKKKILTVEQKAKLKANAAVKKERLRIAELKKTALDAPTRRRLNVWDLIVRETSERRDTSEKTGIGAIAQAASARYKQLTPDRREHFNHLASQQNAAIKAAYRKFIESHTPKEIYDANIARKALARKGSRKLPILQDERQVKGQASSFALFVKDRTTSGDFTGIANGPSWQLIGKEWQALPAPDKKKYEDLALQDRFRYAEEQKAVLGRDVRIKRTAAA